MARLRLKWAPCFPQCKMSLSSLNLTERKMKASIILKGSINQGCPIPVHPNVILSFG